MIHLIWIGWIALEVVANYYQIEIRKKAITHWIWLIPRVIAGTLMMILYVKVGYMWYWAGSYIVFTHLLLFPEGLNLMRPGKKLGYIASAHDSWEEDSKFDLLIERFFNPYVWFWFRVILFISAVGIMLIYGKNTWYEINNGLAILQ